jgi:hypothetical protein
MPIFLLPYLYSHIVLASLASMWSPPSDADCGDR